MFINKLTDCDGEASETQVWIDFALDCGYPAFCLLLLPSAFRSLYLVSVRKRLIHCHFINVFHIAAHRHAHGNTRDAQPEWS